MKCTRNNGSKGLVDYRREGESSGQLTDGGRRRREGREERGKEREREEEPGLASSQPGAAHRQVHLSLSSFLMHAGPGFTNLLHTAQPSQADSQD